MYNQLITPNYNIPYVGGLCEGFVEGTVGQASAPYLVNGQWTTKGVWRNAVGPVNPGETAAWQQNYGNGNHPGETPPQGVHVPVFFSLGSTPAGHVALQLADGRVASSTQSDWHPTAYIHPNIDDLIRVYAKANGGCTYLGWSEYIGKSKIVEGVIMPNSGDVINVYQTINHIQPTQEDINVYTSKPWNVPDGLYYGKISIDLQNQSADIADKANKIVEQDKEIADLKAQLGNKYVPYTGKPLFITQ